LLEAIAKDYKGRRNNMSFRRMMTGAVAELMMSSDLF